MTTKEFIFDPKTIEPSEHSPVVSTLLAVIGQLTRRWQLPDGSPIVATLPKELQGHHFGPTLRAYIGRTIESSFD